jgi:hypothetical protein
VIFALFEPPEWRRCRFQTGLSSCQQPSPDEEQVAEREQDEQMRSVLGQPTIPRFHVTELALDDPEGMALFTRRNSHPRVIPPEFKGLQK